ncbi:LysR family transcriptional regulator [Celeribacter arenosi]|uniref:LysR family transcriptional regulator n=1 Tax=Celeribacter arenosi TaxID=792649 RepID=A0ABP7KGR6_9RHOB
MHRPNWDDYRFVLSVARTGSVSGAARELGVNHATVLRRVAGIEQRLGVQLFDKSVRGYEISADKLRIIEAAREVEAAVGAVERLARVGEAPLAGVIRLTSTDTFCHVVLPPIVAKLASQERGLSFELLSTNAHLDLARLHADVTIRPTFKLPEDLHGEMAAYLGVGYYTRADAPEDHWIGTAGSIARSHITQKLHDVLDSMNVKITAAADSFLTLRTLAEAGMGRTLLPCVLGDASPTLVRFEGPVEIAPVPVFVASHIDLADAPRMRQARHRIARALAAEADSLLGRSAVTA